MLKSTGVDFGPLYSVDGRSDQAVAAGFLAIPWRVVLDEGRLLYCYLSPSAISRASYRGVSIEDQRDPAKAQELGLPLLKTPNPRVLDAFMELVDAKDEQIVAFATKHGVLDLCEHGMPYTHNVGQLRWPEPRRPICSPLRTRDRPPHRLFNYGFESFDVWRSWARRAKGLMKIAAMLMEDLPGAPEHWAEVLDGKPPWRSRRKYSDSGLVSHGEDATTDRHLLCTYVNWWCNLSQLSPHLVVGDRGAMLVRLGSGSSRGMLFGLLGLQMMTRISGVRGMAICSSCGNAYRPSRIPDPARHNFCPNCGRDASVRLAKRKMNARKAQARTMHEQGAHVDEIATHLGAESTTIRGWIGTKKGRRK